MRRPAGSQPVRGPNGVLVGHFGSPPAVPLVAGPVVAGHARHDERLLVTLLSRNGPTSLPPAARAAISAVANLHAVALSAPPVSSHARRLLARTDVLAATNACLPVLDERLLDAAPRLRRVVLYATGTDHVDTELLERRGIRLDTLPDYATTAVAEHGLALLLALATRLHLANDRSRGLADPAVSLRGVELAGRTLGVLGMGRIGRRTAGLGAAIGMQVVGADQRPAAPGDPPRVSMGELLSVSDAIAVCASHRLDGPVLLRSAEIAALRPGALVVNASRAALVDTSAMLQALRERRVRGYAVDDTVADPVADADLLREGRLLQTGHSAWWRDEVLERGAAAWGQQILAAVRTEAAADARAGTSGTHR